MPFSSKRDLTAMVFSSAHITSLGGRIPRGLVMLSQKIEKKVLDGQEELRAQPTRKSTGRLGGRKRERKGNEVNDGHWGLMLVVTLSRREQ